MYRSSDDDAASNRYMHSASDAAGSTEQDVYLGSHDDAVSIVHMNCTINAAGNMPHEMYRAVMIMQQAACT